MNLTKLFHFNYLKQNLKKSRVILAFVMVMLPILNLLIFFMGANDNTINVYDLNDISSLTTLGLFIIPVVISILLFNYVFKKKSIDFVGSMPLNRKTIFITNTIGGIILIIALIGFTTLLLWLASLLLSNIYIPNGVFLDYFTLFTLSYIFVFVACNLAISLSGNVPTTIVVTALILFLVPFLHFVYSNTRNTNEYIDYKCENCSSLVKYYSTNLTEVKEESYTTPTQVILRSLNYNNENSLYVDSALGRMALLIVLYSLVGLLIFQKKELEVCETSFKNNTIHMIVRTLTIVPIMVLVYEVTRYTSFVALIFAFALVLVYSFIYDLITRKSVAPIRINIFVFVIALAILYPFSGFLLGEYTSNKTTEKTISANQIKSLRIEESSLDILKKLNGAIELKDKNIYDLLLARDVELKKEEHYIGRIYVVTEDHEYEKILFVSKEELSDIENAIKNTKTYQESKDIRLKDYDIITIGNNYIELTNKDIEILKKGILSPDEEQSDFFLPVSVYTYKNHELKEEVYYSNITKEVNQMAVDRYNASFKKLLEKSKNMTYSQIEVEDEYKMNYYFFEKSEAKEFISAIKNQPSNVEEKLYKIYISLDNGNKYYHYYVNLSKELLKEFKIDEVEEDDIVDVD